MARNGMLQDVLTYQTPSVHGTISMYRILLRNLSLQTKYLGHPLQTCFYCYLLVLLEWYALFWYFLSVRIMMTYFLTENITRTSIDIVELLDNCYLIGVWVWAWVHIMVHIMEYSLGTPDTSLSGRSTRKVLSMDRSGPAAFPSSDFGINIGRNLDIHTYC